MKLNRKEKLKVKTLLFDYYGDLNQVIKHSGLDILKIGDEFKLFKYINKNYKYFETEKLFNYISGMLLDKLKLRSLKGDVKCVNLYSKVKKILDEKIIINRKIKNKSFSLSDQRELLLSKLYEIAISTNNARLIRIYKENNSSYSDKDNQLILLLPYEFMDDESKTNNDI